MLSPPEEVLASWKPNYVNPPTKGRGIIGMEIFLTVVCFIIVALRVYGRAVMTKTFGLDDALIVFNLVPLTGLAISIILAMDRYGYDRHLLDIPVDRLALTQKMSFVITILYFASVTVTKVSILLFYRRLTSQVSTIFLRLVYLTMAWVILFWIASNIVYFLACRPLESYWMRANPFWLAVNEGKFTCVNNARYIIAAAAMAMVQDFVVCVLPLSLFLKLNVSWRTKVQLGAIFSIGFFLCICATLRMVWIVRFYYHIWDLTWESTPVWIWTGIEAHGAVIIASLPALNQFGRQAVKNSSIGSKLKSLTGKDTTEGYNKTHSRPQTGVASSQSSRGIPKGGIHVTQEVELQSIILDKPPKGYKGIGDPGWLTSSTKVVEEETSNEDVSPKALSN